MLKWGPWALLALGCLGALALILRPGDRDTDEISYGDQSAWMVSRASGEIVRVNGAAGDVATRVSVAENGSRIELVPVGRDVVVMNRDSNEVSLVDGIGLSMVSTIPVDDAGEAALVSNGDNAYLVTRTEVQEITTEPLGMAPAIDLDAPLSSPVVGTDGRLWAIERREGMVRTFQDGDPDRSFTVDFDPDAAALATASDRTVLVDLGTPELRAVAGPGQEPRGCEAGLPTGDPVVGYSTTTTSEPFVAITDARAGSVVVWDFSEGRCRTVQVADAGADLGPAVVDDLTGYVPDYSTGAVTIVDLRAGTSLGRVGVGQADRPFELFESNGEVWFNDPTGSAAALLDRGGIVTVIEKLGEGGGDSLVDAEAGEGDLLTGGNTAGGGLGLDPADGDNGASGSDGAGDDTGDGDGVGGPAGSNVASVVDPSSPPSSVPLGDIDTDPDASAELAANFTFSTSTARVGEPVEFVDRSNGGPTSWSWTFDDGTADQGPIVTKAWEAEGTYTVTLTVDRDDGATDSASVDISVVADDVPVPPVADFAFTSSVVEVGQLVTFSDQSSGSPTSWEWSFGDNTTDTGQTVTHTYGSPGTFTVTLTVSNGQGDDSTQALITVVASVQPPDAQITASTLNPAVGQFVTFESDSTGSAITESWNFGDGSPGASGQVVGHAFTSAGTFTVTLTAANSAGADTASVTVVVSDTVRPPVARFTASSTSVQEGQSVVFTSTSLNAPDSLTWDYGDGNSASGPTVTHSFDDAGVYEVTLTASNSAGSSMFSVSITVAPGGEAPEAAFVASNTNPVIGELVQFTDTSANGPTSWDWDFGDGVSSSAANTSHSFGEAGDFTVTLTVSNGAGSDTTSTIITVLPSPPTASFTATPTTVQLGQPIVFTDLSTGDPESWAWTFGDGTTSTEQNPQHTYSGTGTYSVTLKVTNAGGTSSFTSQVVVQPPPPVASFTVSPASGATTADVVQFTDTTSNDPVEWLWNFGDGATSTTQNPGHQYTAPGSYTVTLRATNAAGSDQASQTVVVARAVVAPVASFSVAPNTTVPAGTTVTFTDTSVNDPTSWTWTLPDGSTPGGQSASFTFTTAGSFPVSLTVANSAGSDTTSQTITVLPPPPTASFGVSVAADGVTVSFTDTSSGGPTGWLWSFGDGASSSAQNPTHVYAAGSYTVSLVASNAGGSSAPAVQQLTITPTPAPAAGFSFVTNDLTVTFTDTSTGSIDTWFWQFGDGATSAVQSPVYTYGVASTYTVTLTVTGPGGSSTVSAPVTVTDPPPPTTTSPPPPPPP